MFFILIPKCSTDWFLTVFHFYTDWCTYLLSSAIGISQEKKNIETFLLPANTRNYIAIQLILLLIVWVFGCFTRVDVRFLQVRVWISKLFIIRWIFGSKKKLRDKMLFSRKKTVFSVRMCSVWSFLCFWLSDPDVEHS